MSEIPNSNKLRSKSDQPFLECDEDRYKLLVEGVKDYAIFMLDAQGYIKTWNLGAQNLKGYTQEEIIDKHFSIFYTQEDLDRQHPANELKIAGKEGRFEEEGWRVKKDGTLFWASVVISAIYTDDVLVGFSKVTRDLSEKKMLEEALLEKNEELRESEERARLLISGIKDYAVFLLSPEGIISTWNEGARSIKGYKAEEVIGKHFSMFYTAQSREAQFPQFELKKALEEGRFEDEGWRVKKDGTQFWANAIITPIYDSLNFHIGFTKITRDLTERVRNEELMRKNMELHKVNTDLDNFIYTASHDLKSPIANLEGFLSLIQKKISPKLADADVRIIELMDQSIQKLKDTIESLVEVTKAQKNFEDLLVEVSFADVFEEVKDEMQTSIEEVNPHIEIDFKIPNLFFARASLKSILYNLLSNALKYRSPERRLSIKITSDKEGDYTVLSIKDNGLGLTHEQQSKLFSMFKRFHSHVEGTGIGLYIVKRTVENYQGKITVDSRYNQGTEFKLYFKNENSESTISEQ